MVKKESNFVLASTHDLEFVDLLDQEYEFSILLKKLMESLMTFDYKIKEGYSSTRNAIKLLDISGYPSKIVTQAMEMANMLEKHGTVNINTSL